MRIGTRTLLSIIKSLFGKKTCRLQDPFVLSFRVWPTDLGGLVMNNARYFTLMEACEFDTAVRTGLVLFFLQKKWRATMRSQFIVFKRPLKCFQKFDVKSQIIYWDEKWLYYEHLFLRKGKLVAYGYVKVAWLEKGKIISPEQVAARRGLILISQPKPAIVSQIEQVESINVMPETKILKL